MLKKLSQYRLLSILVRPYAPWVSACFIAAIFIANLLISNEYGILPLVLLAFTLFILLLYVIATPMLGYWACLQIKRQYGPKTLHAILQWIENETQPSVVNVAHFARQSGELIGRQEGD